MGGSTADTPTTPEFVRVSDADRDHAVDELRNEFVEGRLSHETFVYRMRTALDARNHGQLAGLFADLPPRRIRLLARVRTALRAGHGSPDAQARTSQRISGPQGVWRLQWEHGPPDIDGAPADRRIPGGYEVQAPRSSGSGHSDGSGEVNGPGRPQLEPAPLVFPPGRGDRFTIGRARDCDLCLTDLSVSRLHAELVRGTNGWLLNDLGSQNGTRINGWLVRETVPVRAGDRVEFGSLTFVIRDEPWEPPPPR